MACVQDPAIAGSIAHIQTQENVAKEQAAAVEAARLASFEARKVARQAAQVTLHLCPDACQPVACLWPICAPLHAEG